MSSKLVFKAAIVAVAIATCNAAFAFDLPSWDDVPWYIVPGIGTLVNWLSLF